MRAWVLALMLLPLASGSQVEVEPGIWNPQEATPVRLWLHCFGFQDCPINTQEPESRYSGESMGLVSDSQSCQTVPNVGLVSTARHTRYAFSTPGYVDYDFDEGGKPRYHAVRGLGYDVHLDTDATPFYTYFVAIQPSAGGGSVAPLLVPDVKVVARLGESDDVSLAHKEMDAGATIAYGESEAVTLHPMVDHPQVTFLRVAGIDVYEFRFPLAYELDTIREDESFHIRTDVFVDLPGCNDPYTTGYVTPGAVQPFSGDGVHPHLDLAIFNPLQIRYLHPQFIGDDLVFHASAVSPWGSYDIDEDSIQFKVVEAPDAPIEQVALINRFNQHDHQIAPLDVAWLWPGPLPLSGTMHAMTSFRTDQGAQAQAIASFEFGSQRVTMCDTLSGDVQCIAHVAPPEETTPIPLVAALLGILIALWRRDNG